MHPVWMWLSVDCSFTANKCSKSATKTTPWFGHILMGQYLLVVLYTYIHVATHTTFIAFSFNHYVPVPRPVSPVLPKPAVPALPNKPAPVIPVPNLFGKRAPVVPVLAPKGVVVS